jgi:hypothetical protein
MIKKSNIQWTAKTLINQIARGNVNFDCAIQRGYTWDQVRNSLLIHSMIEDYPIPAFYFAKRADGRYDGLDGKQRSNAIMGFINGLYALCEDFDIVKDEEGEEYNFSEDYFEDLPEWAQEHIKDYSLTIYYFEELTEEQYDNLFFRLNNGKPLTSVELTRVKAKSLKKFQEMAKHDLINLAVTDKGKVRYNHENLVMQAWAVCFVKDEDFSFETKIFRHIIENAEVNKMQVEELTNYFNIILNIYNECDLEDKKEKRIAKRILTRTHLVALTKAMMVAIQNDYEIPNLIEWIKVFFDGGKSATVDTIYNNTCGSGSARKDKVDMRMNAIVDHMNKYMEKIGQMVVSSDSDGDDCQQPTA